jgi:hypothetical protein
VSGCMKVCEGNNGTKCSSEGEDEPTINDQPHNQTRDGFKYFRGESITS